jgi:hypothetical protein
MRAFVKAAHPDAGGDPELFLAGLRHWQHGTAAAGRAPANVVFHRRRRGVARLTGWWPRTRARRGRVH